MPPTTDNTPGPPGGAENQGSHSPPGTPSGKTPSLDPGGDPLSRALLEFTAAWGRGEPPDPAAFCQAHPEAGPELRRRIDEFLFVARHMDRTREGPPPPPPPPSPKGGPLPERIGPYKVIRLLGEGGMGRVYLVEQEKPVHRVAALKLTRPGMDTQRVLKRFDAERQALVMMDHPNIARLLDVGGTEEGRPYFLMEYIDGLNIKEYCDRKRAGIRERVRLFMQVLEGVKHAHQKAIIHRDLKPSNILVTEKEGKPIPKIIDFGLARALESRLVEGSLYSIPGQVLGTPEYMSPEQAGYKNLDVDTRTDIYSLGVILYELLTGELPYPGEKPGKKSLFEIQKAILEEEPVRPSTKAAHQAPDRALLRGLPPKALARKLRGDLDWILLKALEKDRERRYKTAGEFLEDLRRYLENEPVLARGPSPLYRARKFFRKHGILVSAASLALLGIFGGLWVAMEKARAEARAESAARKKIQDALSFADQTTRRLLEIAARKEADQGANETAWQEDFEEYPKGLFPPRGGSPCKWKLAGDNQDVWIDYPPTYNPEKNKCLHLHGSTSCPDHALVSTPLDRKNYSYCTDFVLRFRLLLGKTPPAGDGAGPASPGAVRDPQRMAVLLCKGPDYRAGPLVVLAVDDRGFFRYTWRKGPEKGLLRDPVTGKPARLPLGRESFSHISLHYHRIGVEKVKVALYLDGIFKGEKVRKAAEGESRMGWLLLSGGPGDAYLDEIRLLRRPRPQPWKKFLPGGGKRSPKRARFFLLSPGRVTFAGAKELARRWQGKLARTGIPPSVDSWILENFGRRLFWVKKGAWGIPRPSPSAEAPLPGPTRRGRPGPASRSFSQGRKPRLLAGVDPNRLLPALLEFPALPRTASAVSPSPGWAPGGRKDPRLLATAPPVAGAPVDLLLQGVPPSARAFLLLGRKEGPFFLPGPFLHPLALPFSPEEVFLFSRHSNRPGDSSLHLTLPSGVAAGKKDFFCQALLLPVDQGFPPLGLSNVLEVHRGIAPPGGSLLWAAETGMGCRDHPMEIKGLCALPGGSLLMAGNCAGWHGILPRGKGFSHPRNWTRLNPEGGKVGFLLSLGPFGQTRWARSLEKNHWIESMALLPGTEDVLLAGFLGRPPHCPFREDAGRADPGEKSWRKIFLARCKADTGKISTPRILGQGSRILSVRLAAGRGKGGEGRAQPLLYLSCVFQGDLALGKEGKRKVFHSPQGGQALLLAGLGGEGKLLWARLAATSKREIRQGGLCLDPAGSVIWAGSFLERAEISLLAPKTHPLTLASRNGMLDIFMFGAGPEGGLLWAVHGEGVMDDLAHQVACGRDGSLWLTGGFHHQVKFCRVFPTPFVPPDSQKVKAGGGFNVFLARFTSDGEYQWGKVGWARGEDNQGTGVALREEKGRVRKVYLAGYFQRTLDFGAPLSTPGDTQTANYLEPPRLLLTPTGGPGKKDLFLAAFTPRGEVLWATQAGGIGDDQALHLTLLPGGAPVAGGTFQGPATFGLGEAHQAVLVRGNLFAARFTP